MRRALVSLLLATACSSDDATVAPVDASVDAAPDSPSTADWVVSLDGTTGARKVNPALLGHYDLSGALYRYDQKPGLANALAPAGFKDWRIGVGRWEAATQMLPTLTDNTPCTALVPQSLAPMGTTDLDLVKARDWFTDDGKAVAPADVANDARYSLAYVRQAIDVAHALGTTPYVGIDHMPRAFSVNKTFTRTTANWKDACNWSWVNAVSNVAPDDQYIYNAPTFAAAVVGMVQRIVEGSGAEPARDAPYWEFWNEPELPYAWNPTFDPCVPSDCSKGKLPKFFVSAGESLLALDDYRTKSSSPAVKKLHFGLASFALADTAVGVMAALDKNATKLPVDFFSFHAYSNDPLEIVSNIAKVTTARDASKRYSAAELSLSEWGPSLDASMSDKTMDMPLLVATVIARGATLGLDRAYHTFFYDYFQGIPWGIVDNAVKPTPLLHAYELLAAAIANGGDSMVATSALGGSLGGGDGAVLVVKDNNGAMRALLVNRGAVDRVVRVDFRGTAMTPTKVRVFSDPTKGAQDVAASQLVVLPSKSIALLEL